MLEKTPLQIYSSAIIFSPRSSEVRRLFLGQVPPWIRLLSQVEEQWGASVQTLVSHSDGIDEMVFSPDGQLVASEAWGKTVRLRDAMTGESHVVLKGHSGGVSALVSIASGWGSNTMRLWDATTGESRGVLEGHSGSIAAVMFSPDWRLVASGRETRRCDCGTPQRASRAACSRVICTGSRRWRSRSTGGWWPRGRSTRR